MSLLLDQEHFGSWIINYEINQWAGLEHRQDIGVICDTILW